MRRWSSAGWHAWLVACVVGLAGARAAEAEPALQSLARAAGAGQGVYAVAGDGTVLVQQAASLAVHPASVTKVATTLALLERLGEDHRFTTRLVATGPLRDGRVDGDLVVVASGDPFVVDESAILLLQKLGARGVRRVAGTIAVRGELIFDWQPDPDGRRLARVLTGAAGEEAWRAVARANGDPRSFREAALGVAGGAHARSASASGDDGGRDLAVLRSPRLLHVVKVLNGYSNNVFHYASDAIGGPSAVEAIARAHVPAEMRDEIVIENGAGAGTTNRLSPRAAVALLDALSAQLAHGGHDLTAALPVSGFDPGTLEDRFAERPALVVGKTGTFGSVGASALVGALRSERYGTVRFAVLNHGVPVPEARRRQDDFVRELAESVHATTWPYARPTRPAYLEAQVD
ncbi:MAG TPA: D-alanyl-D-alanine carboxypeptidase [Candidatus Binatia bacterium]|nr:D-alanyl-D-alanine carboxypeptidase [Candidatus Binatia bacterium]